MTSYGQRGEETMKKREWNPKRERERGIKKTVAGVGGEEDKCMGNAVGEGDGF